MDIKVYVITDETESTDLLVVDNVRPTHLPGRRRTEGRTKKS